MNEHASEVDTVRRVQAKNPFKEIDLGLAVETIVVEMECAVTMLRMLRVIAAHDQMGLRLEPEYRWAICLGAIAFDQFNLFLGVIAEGFDFE